MSEPKFPCLKCGKPVPKSRRDKHTNQYKEVGAEGQCCTARCWKQLCEETAAYAAAEARWDREAELQAERNADAAFHMAHPED